MYPGIKYEKKRNLYIIKILQIHQLLIAKTVSANSKFNGENKGV